ncbi:MAG: tRNA 2-thiouridine(34) synthase MnmA [Planctomycetota bacterium]|nr:tRNA 2-thiouridine(34) synthase MnmA [Planctomycetota bacterium]
MTSEAGQIHLMPPVFEEWRRPGDTSRSIAVLMSGGVDSSVTALLLKQAGWDVVGITMKIPVSCSGSSRTCCGADAAFVCNELNIPHYFIDVTAVFKRRIIEPFQKAYAAGLTPNPCADCNTFLKFSLVWDFLKGQLGITRLASGHYARISGPQGKIRLGMAADSTKDQSYFLYGITADRLTELILPLGELTKVRVRRIASEMKLSVAEKRESMELCFTGEGDYRAALADDGAQKAGDITDMQGKKIGVHKGVAHYTLGQRRGIGFAGGKPLYVGRIDAASNTIALGTKEQVSRPVISAKEVNVLISEEFATGVLLFGRIRSYGRAKPCGIVCLDNNTVTVEFEQPQFAPCPGQKLVLYDGDNNIVAGGTITADL